MDHIRSKKLKKYINTFRKYTHSLSVVNEHYRIELVTKQDILDPNIQIRDHHIKRSRKLFKKLVKLEIKLFGKRLI